MTVSTRERLASALLALILVAAIVATSVPSTT